PGVGDPPNFKLGECSTQRNLSEAGREQARRVGAAFVRERVKLDQVRSSAWCRCVDTATLAFNAPTVWAALGSPFGATETTGAAHLGELRKALVAASARSGKFQVWVTHSFVQSDLASDSTRSGEALIVRALPNSQPQVLARWALPT
ncbi:MAG: histidine phosphatase family protein, partial [Burkholderiaceae bacterium]|nr:histidine phosphatase family protein [Burkholderiaceae bacterium]